MATRLIWPMAMVAVSLTLLVGHPWLFQVTIAPPESVVAMVPVVLGGVSCFSAAWLTARLVVLILERTSRDQRRLPKLLQESVTVAFFLIALMGTIALALDGALVGSVATSGVVIAILGFALRNIIADIVLGMALGLERSYRIGDWLKIDNGVSGVVIDINWRTTRLLTRNQTHVILPNSRIAQRQLVNYSVPKRQYRDQLRICLPHSIPVAEAKRVLSAAALTAHRNLTGPAPDVLAVTYTLGGIEYAVRYWVPNYSEEAACRDALLTVIDAALRREGLNILQNTSEPAGLAHQAGELVEVRQEDGSVLRQDWTRLSK